VQTPESGTVAYVYNPDGTVQSKTDAKGQVTRYTYETYGRVSKAEAYLARGNVTRSVTPGAIHNTGYDIGGLAVSADDGQGHAVTIVPAAGTNSSLPGAVLPTGGGGVLDEVSVRCIGTDDAGDCARSGERDGVCVSG
jgi:YD repeat-containing protein